MSTNKLYLSTYGVNMSYPPVNVKKLLENPFEKDFTSGEYAQKYHPNSYDPRTGTGIRPVPVAARPHTHFPPVHAAQYNPHIQPAMPPQSMAAPRSFCAYQPSLASTGSFAASAPVRWEVQPLFTTNFARIPLATALIPGATSLTDSGRSTVRKIAKQIGKLILKDETLGAAILISKHYLLTSRHVIEGRLIKNIIFALGQITINCIAVVEEIPELDYAIIHISVPYFHIPTLMLGDAISQETILLHYPLDGDLQVSGHSAMPTGSQERVGHFDSVSHDSDSGSCGGAYIDAEGKIVALHLGVDINEEGYSMSASMGTGSAERYWISISKIHTTKPNSRLFTADTPPSMDSFSYFIFPSDRMGDWEREGNKSQEVLAEKLKTSHGGIIPASVRVRKLGKKLLLHSKMLPKKILFQV